MSAGAVLVDQAPVREDAGPEIVHLGFTGEDRPLCGQEGLRPLGHCWEAAGAEVCVVCEDLAAAYARTGRRP